MAFDTIIRNARIGGAESLVDVGIIGGRIAAIDRDPSVVTHDAVQTIAADGRLLVPGFIETHIHLDKACISDRCTCRTSTLQEVIAAVADSTLR